MNQAKVIHGVLWWLLRYPLAIYFVGIAFAILGGKYVPPGFETWLVLAGMLFVSILAWIEKFMPTKQPC